MKKVFLILLALVLAISVGVVGCAPAEEEEEEVQYIKLGAPLALGFPDGICARDNLKLAVDEINEAGGFTVGNTTYKFTLLFADTNDLAGGATDAQVLGAIESLLAKGAQFMVGGPIRSDFALKVMDWNYDKGWKKVFLWSAGFFSPAFGPKVAENMTRYKYCFRLQGRVTELVGETVSLMEAVNATYNFGPNPKAYIIFQGVAHARAAAVALNASLVAEGWTITGYDEIPTGVSDFSASLIAASTTGTQVLVPWFDMPESAGLIRQWYDGKYDMIPIGFLVPAQDSNAWYALGGKCAYVTTFYPRAGVTPINEHAQHYINLYKAEISPIGPALTWVGPTCYQAIYVLKDAIQRAGSLDTDAVITALEGMDMTGVFGRMRFVLEAGPLTHDLVYSMNPAQGAVSTWVQWVSEERRTVYPAVVKTHDVVLPPWWG